MRLHFKELFTVLFIVICFSGFLFQLQQVSQSYFRYQTISRLKVNVKDSETYSQIYFCARYAEVLDRSNYKEYKGLRSVPPIELVDLIDEMSNLTIRHIFKLTPQANETIKHCKLRIKDSYTITTMSSKECYDAFDVKKFYMQEFMCYAFFPKLLTRSSGLLIA